jgi:hypothetical protein
MENVFVGIGAHSKESVYVMQDAAGNVLATRVGTHDRFGVAAVVGATQASTRHPRGVGDREVAFFVARQLAELGLRPMVVDAHEVRLKAHRPRQKSDVRDAFELCEGLLRGIYRVIVHVPPVEILRLRETLTRRWRGTHGPRFRDGSKTCLRRTSPSCRGARRVSGFGPWKATVADLSACNAQAGGHLRIWAALAEVCPQAEELRCWNHRIMNVIDQLPKKRWAAARELLRQIAYAETRRECKQRRD